MGGGVGFSSKLFSWGTFNKWKWVVRFQKLAIGGPLRFVAKGQLVCFSLLYFA